MSFEKPQNIDVKRGRPLDLSRNKVILETTINLISENGYDSLTLDLVAKKAKVGKGTIYRRWSTKKDLVIEAAIQMSPFETSKESLNKNQDLRGQIVDLLSLLFMEENKNYQKAMTAICNAVAWDEQSDIREAFNLSYGKEMISIIEPYIHKNSLPDEDIALIIDIGPALIMYNMQRKKWVNSSSYVEHLVDRLIMPLISN